MAATGVFDSAVSRLGDKVKAGEWVDSGAARVRSQLLPKLPASLQGSADQAVNRITREKDSLGTLTGGAFASITSLLSFGLEDEAKMLFLREHATHAERQDALKAAIAGSHAAHVDKEKAWAAVKATALDVLKIAATNAIPLLLAMA